MRGAIPIAVATLAIACQSGPSEHLLGEWRSDPVATFGSLEREDQLTPLQRARLAEVLDSLEVRYEPGRATSRAAGWSRSWEYRVVGEGPDYVDIELVDSRGAEPTVRRVWVEDDRMWIQVDQLGIREYYVRVPD